MVKVGQLLSIVVLASSSDSTGELYSSTIDDDLKYAEALIFVLFYPLIKHRRGCREVVHIINDAYSAQASNPQIEYHIRL